MNRGKKTPPPFYMYLLCTQKQGAVVLSHLEAFLFRENLPQRNFSFAAGFCLVAPPLDAFMPPLDPKRGASLSRQSTHTAKNFELE